MRAAISRQALLAIASVLFIVPAYIIVVNSFKTKNDIIINPVNIPFEKLTLDNYIDAFASKSFSIGAAYIFSSVITISTVALVIIIGAMVAYVMARSQSRFARVAYFTVLAGLMIPPQVVIIPAVQVLRQVELIGTVPGLILYNIGTNLPLAVFIYYGFIRTIPIQLDESASIDGAGPIRTFFHIIFPIMTPATASLAVLLAVFVWNDFLNPLLILGPLGQPTVTTGIFRAAGLFSTDWGAVFAYVILSSAPMLILFIFFQKFVIRGLTSGAVKE